MKTELTSITTPRMVISVGDIIYHAGKDKGGNLGIEEMRVKGFKLGYKSTDYVIFTRKPKLVSLQQFSWIGDNQEIRTSSISDSYHRCWYFYNYNDALLRLKIYLEKEQGKVEDLTANLADKWNNYNMLLQHGMYYNTCEGI